MTRTLKKSATIPPAVERCIAGPPPRAGSFIVTIYGDVIEPRGGTVWMGTLIEVCADHGISEGLVRTAVSRLVASGRLVGERLGRRSYYRLTQEARGEFAGAAMVVFAMPPAGGGWLFRFGGGLSSAFHAAGWADAGGYAVAPDRDDLPRPEGLLFSGQTVSGQEDLVGWAEQHWKLAPISEAYRAFAEMFRGVSAAITNGYDPDGAVGLALRLRVVHEYRRVLLSDPRLPAVALPRDWPGVEARHLFVSLYLALADTADRHVRQTFRDAEGFLPMESPAIRARIEALKAEISS